MTAAALDLIRDIIQEDVGNRGLRSDPSANLISAFPGDFAAACESLASTSNAAVAIVTGFYIPHAVPPCGETDGPLGTIFLARALTPLQIKVVLVTDSFCARALEAGLAAAGLEKAVRLVVLPSVERGEHMSPGAGRGSPDPALPSTEGLQPPTGDLRSSPVRGQETRAQLPSSLSDYWNAFINQSGPLTHLIALERVGPSHTPESLQAQPGTTSAEVQRFLAEVPAEHHDRCHTMRGRDITASMSPAHRLFEVAGQKEPGIATIGIGDGGNEIGMGKIPWSIIRRNIPNGGLVACRVPTDHLIVCGVSNWGAYGLGAGVRLLRGASNKTDLFDPEQEEALLRIMVEEGPLVDGVSGQATVSVDGLPLKRYLEPLKQLQQIRATS
jgi:hypothetical protein